MALGDPPPMSFFVGAPATSLEGEEVGAVSDVLVDGTTGRIRFVVVRLGPEGRPVAVPWELVSISHGERHIRLGVTTRKLLGASSLSAEDPRIGSADWQYDTYTYFGSRPPWDEPWEDANPVATYSRRRRVIVPALVLAVLLLVVVAGLGYVVLRQGWTAPVERFGVLAAAVRQTTDAVRSTSADAATTAKVKTALALSKNVSALNVNVDTFNGVATLTGKVPSPEIRDLAGQIAADTSGVRTVQNLLKVDPELSPDQGRQYLAHRVEQLERQRAITEALQEIPEMEGAKIKVRVNGDLVVLEGTVVSDAQKSRAEAVARSFGVHEVSNQLRNLNQAS